MTKLPLPELTEEDKKNGWTPESLAVYRAERQRAANVAIDRSVSRRPPRPRAAAGKGSFGWGPRTQRWGPGRLTWIAGKRPMKC